MPAPALVATGLGIARAVAIMLAYEIATRYVEGSLNQLQAPTITEVYQSGVEQTGAETVEEKRTVATAAAFVADVLASGDALIPHNRRTGERLPLNYFHINTQPGGNGQMWFTPRYYSKKSMDAQFRRGRSNGEFRERRRISQESTINNPPR